MIQTFEIKGRLDGLNEYINACRTHYHKGAKVKRKNQDIVCKSIVDYEIQPIKKKVDVYFHWIEKNCRRDKDNISSGGHKFIFDALVEMGIISNDGWKEINEIHDKFSVNASNPRIVVTLEEVGNESKRETSYPNSAKKENR